MRLLAQILVIALASTALAVAACGDDDEAGNDPGGNGSVSPTASVSPSAMEKYETSGASPEATGSPEATETPRPTEAAPTPDAPSLNTSVTKIGEATMSFVLVPGGQFPVDVLGLIQPGTETPPCAAFVFAFTWQITDPFPPDENAVTWRLTRQDGTEDLGSGADGSATVGCGQLMAVNTGPDMITVNVHYVQGAIPG